MFPRMVETNPGPCLSCILQIKICQRSENTCATMLSLHHCASLTNYSMHSAASDSWWKRHVFRGSKRQYVAGVSSNYNWCKSMGMKGAIDRWFRVRTIEFSAEPYIQY